MTPVTGLATWLAAPRGTRPRRRGPRVQVDLPLDLVSLDSHGIVLALVSVLPVLYYSSLLFLLAFSTRHLGVPSNFSLRITCFAYFKSGLSIEDVPLVGRA